MGGLLVNQTKAQIEIMILFLKVIALSKIWSHGLVTMSFMKGV